eukprot:TCALIF_02995-PA protein Name:"Protein of unknown function" AED:0.21 eAED:0.21 QI:46/1/0/1/1/1/2/311/68
MGEKEDPLGGLVLRVSMLKMQVPVRVGIPLFYLDLWRSWRRWVQLSRQFVAQFGSQSDHFERCDRLRV